jgi:hypothetical protein
MGSVSKKKIEAPINGPPCLKQHRECAYNKVRDRSQVNHKSGRSERKVPDGLGKEYNGYGRQPIV